MFLGDSQTAGRAPNTTILLSHVTAFEHIWDQTFGDTATSYTDGFGGRVLIDTHAHYSDQEERLDRTWVHFQESGNQASVGGEQDTAAEFCDTWENFVREIKATTPNAIISTETAFNFGRGPEGSNEANRDWGPYNDLMRIRAAQLEAEGIKVYIAEVDRNIKALDAIVGSGEVWLQEGETNAFHYEGLGNLMVALSVFDALGYDVNTLNMSGITEISSAYKAHCLNIINSYN
jgi:hypothetical protein